MATCKKCSQIAVKTGKLRSLVPFPLDHVAHLCFPKSMCYSIFPTAIANEQVKHERYVAKEASDHSNVQSLARDATISAN